MYFITLEVKTAEALYQLGLEDPTVVSFLTEILSNAVVITSAERAKTKITLKRDLYLSGLQTKLKKYLKEPSATKLFKLTQDLFQELDTELNSYVKEHECLPSPYVLFKKERNKLFITRMK